MRVCGIAVRNRLENPILPRRSNPISRIPGIWIASLSLSSGAHSRDRLARNESGTIFPREDYFLAAGRIIMARKYSKKASAKVRRAMKERKAGTLKSGRSGRKVKSRKQAIAIGLSEARARGAKVPKKASKKRKSARKRKSKR